MRPGCTFFFVDYSDHLEVAADRPHYWSSSSSARMWNSKPELLKPLQVLQSTATGLKKISKESLSLYLYELNGSLLTTIISSRTDEAGWKPAQISGVRYPALMKRLDRQVVKRLSVERGFNCNFQHALKNGFGGAYKIRNR